MRRTLSIVVGACAIALAPQMSSAQDPVPPTAVVNHIGLVTTDMERSRRFYTEVFGFRYDRDLRLSADKLGILRQEQKADIHAVYLVLGGVTLELMQFDPVSRPAAGARTFGETGLTHLSLSVNDPAETVRLAEARGGSIFSQEGRAYMLRDPDGQLIEVLTMAYHNEVEAGRATRAAAAAKK